jgi:hypothetical protein
VKALDRDGLREAARRDEPPAVDRRHPARRNLVVQEVTTDPERHDRARILHRVHARLRA